MRGGKREGKGLIEWKKFSKNCPHRIVLGIEPRPVNGLNVEIGSFSDRCFLKTPAHWPKNATGLRWIGSGGSAIVFGRCTMKCALGHEWCPECGHRKESHYGQMGCIVDVKGWPCACMHYARCEGHLTN